MPHTWNPGQLTTAVLLATMCVVGGTASEVSGQLVRGRVVESSLGRGIPHAEVLLVDTAGIVVGRAAADSTGQFSLTAPPRADLSVYAEALGYLAMIDGPLDLRSSPVIDIEMVLRAAPIDVPGVSVTVEARSQVLSTSGFYGRMSLGQGFHFDRTALVARGEALLLSDWLRGIPGVSVDNTGHVTLSGMPSGTGSCPYRVFLDGLLVVVQPFGSDREWVRELVRPAEIEGIEVYTRPSQVPVQYSGAQGGCGVILIWTR